MSEDYGKRVLNHYKVQNDVLWQLMFVAQLLCPSGEWVFQVFATTSEPDKIQPHKLPHKFQAVFTNGDDNVTAVADTPAAAVAQLIYYALNGSVFPLTGNGGRKFYPADMGWTRTQIDEA